jgi:hypothetical protein
MNHSTIKWKIDNIDEISGHKTTVLGNPKILTIPGSKAIEFNGENDALILNTNPLAGASEFTIEVIFYPHSDGLEEQRFLHFQEIDSRRILIELRLTDSGKWFLDTYIKSDQSDCTLYASDFHHPTNTWYHAALVLKDNEMNHYVNGKKEMTGKIDFIPMAKGRTSIGCRLNKVCWFKGVIRQVKISNIALSPDQFEIV